MSQTRTNIAIAVSDEVIHHMKSTLHGCLDDPIVKSALEALPEGKTSDVKIIDWRDKTINWHTYDAIVVTSTWNMHHFPDEFSNWLDRCESDGKKRFINDIDILKLGIKKHAYIIPLIDKFGETDSKSGSVIPTIFVGVDGQNEKKSLTQILEELRKNKTDVWSGDVVIKPNTSADGENTYRLTHDNKLATKDHNNYLHFNDADKMFSKLLATKKHNGVMIQPFMKAVENHGEFQLVFFSGKCSHATVKATGFKNSLSKNRRPIQLDQLPNGMLEFAESAIRFLNETYSNKITRARVDLFAGTDGPIVSEIELVEPNTNINRLENHDRLQAATNFAKAIYARIESLKLINSLAKQPSAPTLAPHAAMYSKAASTLPGTSEPNILRIESFKQ